jgi:hypothetical protein
MGRSKENEVRKALICGYNFPKVEKLLESCIGLQSIYYKKRTPQ